MKRKNKILVLFSGGIDSTTLLWHLGLKDQNEIYTLHFNYGQPRFELEEDRVKKIVNEAPFSIVPSVLNISTSIFLPNPPEKKMNNFVPARNAIFLSLAQNFAFQLNVDQIAIGIQFGNFLDVRPEFIDRFNFMLDYCTEKPKYVIAPFATWDKGKVIRRGIEIDAPLHLTVSCEDAVWVDNELYAEGRKVSGDEPHWKTCGVCNDCKTRAKYGLKEV